MGGAKWQPGKGVKNLHGTCEQSEQRIDLAYKTRRLSNPLIKSIAGLRSEVSGPHMVLSLCSLGEVSAGLLGCVDSSRGRDISYRPGLFLFWNRECCKGIARSERLIWLLEVVP